MWNKLKALLRGNRGGADQAWNQLLRACLADRERAERLVQMELARSPGISRSEACRRALIGYRRDNH